MMTLDQVKRDVIEAIIEMDHEDGDNARESIMEADSLAEIGAILESHFGFQSEDTMEFILDNIVDEAPEITTKDHTADLQILVDGLDPCDSEGSVCQMIVDTVGEYEHGTADVEDVFPGATMDSYAAVVRDLIETIAAQI